MDALLWQDKSLSLLHQGKYPAEEIWYDCNTLAEVLDALAQPAAVVGEAILSSVAGYAYCLAALEYQGSDTFYQQLSQAREAIIAARPQSTAVKEALSNMEKCYAEYKLSDQLMTALLATAVTIHRQDVVACRAMAREGRDILADESNIVLFAQGGVFHAGATGDALGILRGAARKGKNTTVFLCENRPKSQSVQLAHELNKDGISVKMIPDHAVASLMPRRSCDMVLIEGLRVAENGDLLAPPGAYSVAISAFFHSIPVYATLYSRDIDKNAKTGEAFAEAQTNLAPEAMEVFARNMPAGVEAYCPKYDIILNQILTGLITDKGILFQPFQETIAESEARGDSRQFLTF